jgi:lipopolysaccharide biosynthesis glycosyltransferase
MPTLTRGVGTSESAAGKTTVELACAARHDYVPHSAAMLHSALTSSPELAFRIHFLHGADLPADDPRRLTELVEGLGGTIHFHEIAESDVAGLRTRTLLPASHWYRIFLPRLLPDVPRVLYLDGDLIVLSSLERLWGTDLQDNYLAAVSNVFQSNDTERPQRLGLPADRHYFNSGVMLMNLDLMRRDDATSALVDCATRNFDLLSWPEQDALNLVLGHRRLALHPRWNLMNSILLFPWAGDVLGAEAVDEARRDPAIRHFEGPTVNKPWHVLCDRGMRELYLEHRRQTPWPTVKLDGVTPANLARRWWRDLRGRGREPAGSP